MQNIGKGRAGGRADRAHARREPPQPRL